MFGPALLLLATLWGSPPGPEPIPEPPEGVSDDGVALLEPGESRPEPPSEKQAGLGACSPGLRESFIVCMDRARAVPTSAAEGDTSVAAARACLGELEGAMHEQSVAQLLHLDPQDPLFLARSGKAKLLLDEARASKLALELALGEVGRAPAAEISTVVEGLRSISNESLRQLQRINALVSGRNALVVRGGVSMGAYQAGYIYYQTEFLKHHSERHAARQHGFSVASGSSAGAINALIAGVSSCREIDDDFLESLFYRVWVGVGFYIDEGWPSLLDEVDDPRAVFSKAPLEKAQTLIEEEMLDPDGWVETLPRCHAIVGLTTTRTRPRDLAIGVDIATQRTHIDLDLGLGDDDDEAELEAESRPELSAALQEERFGFRLEAHGSQDPTRPLHIHNVRPRVFDAKDGYSARALEQLRGELYPFAGRSMHDPVEITDVLTVTRASAAFPIAFAPERLDYGVVRADGSVERQDDVDLIDGGVFDNHPFGFAASLREWTRRPGEVCDPLDSLVPDRPTEFLFVEPSLVSFEAGAVHERPMQLCGGDSRDCLLGTYAEFALGFLESSREARLLKDADDLPYLRVQQDGVPGDSIDLPRRGLPIAGEQLAHFLAFFETDFRVYDFIVGMVDAERNLREHPTWGYSDAFPLISEPRVDCLRAYWAARDAGQLPADIVVKKGEVPVLPEVCRELYREDSPELGRREAGADRLEGDNHNFVALLVASHDYMAWLASPQYRPGQEFDRYFGELDRAEFRFIDLLRLARNRVWALPGLLKIDASRARKLVREITEESIHRVARRQTSKGSQALIEIVGKAAANLTIDYRHPSKVLGLGLTFTGLEFMFGTSPNRLRLGSTTLRFDVGFRAHRFARQVLVDPSPEYVAIPPEDSINAEPQWRMSFETFHHWTLSGPGFFGAVKKGTHGAIIQTELGVGFVLSEGIAFAPEVHRALRYGPELALGLTVFQRIGLGLSASVWTDGCTRRAAHCLINPAYVDTNYDRTRYAISAHLSWRWLPL